MASVTRCRYNTIRTATSTDAAVIPTDPAITTVTSEVVVRCYFMALSSTSVGPVPS